MEDVELKNENAVNQWAGVATQLRLSQLEHLERNTVHIQCIGSTDFVLGRQTNFNGPVTIINCPDVLKRIAYLQEGKARGEQQIVIQEKVISQSAATRIHNIATAQQVLQADQETLDKCRNRAPLFLCMGLLLVAVVAAPTFLTMASTKDESETSQCIQLADNVCLYSQFQWKGRPTSAQAKPLQLPVPYLAISQTSQDKDYCYEYNACLEVVQSFQLNRTVDDACNFLLGGDGNVYEDLGWRLVSIPETPVSDKLLRICFMGDFAEDWPTYPQVQAVGALVHFAVDRNYVAEDYVLLGWKASAERDDKSVIWMKTEFRPRSLSHSSSLDRQLQFRGWNYVV